DDRGLREIWRGRLCHLLRRPRRGPAPQSQLEAAAHAQRRRPPGGLDAGHQRHLRVGRVVVQLCLGLLPLPAPTVARSFRGRLDRRGNGDLDVCLRRPGRPAGDDRSQRGRQLAGVDLGQCADRDRRPLLAVYCRRRDLGELPGCLHRGAVGIGPQPTNSALDRGPRLRRDRRRPGLHRDVHLELQGPVHELSADYVLVGPVVGGSRAGGHVCLSASSRPAPDVSWPGGTRVADRAGGGHPVRRFVAVAEPAGGQRPAQHGYLGLRRGHRRWRRVLAVGAAMSQPVVLTIAGSDSGAGAGIQADLKTFAALGVYGVSVVTAITAQNTVGVRAVQEIDSDVIAAQLDAVAEDFSIAALKTGMLSSAAIIDTVVAGLQRHALRPLVVDPVMIAKSGDRLLREDAVETLRRALLPLADVATANLPQAEVLAGITI